MALLAFPFYSHSVSIKQNEFPPGIYGSLKKLVSINQKIYLAKNKKLLSKTKVLSDLEQASDIKLDPDFMLSIMLHTQGRYLNLLNENICSLYNLLNTQLVHSAEGEVQSIFINYKNKKNKRAYAIVSKETFLKKIIPGECNEIIKAQSMFKPNNLKKTLRNYRSTNFSNYSECYKRHDEFKTNFQSPYICDMYEKLKNLNKLKTKLLRTNKNNKSLKRILRNQIAYSERLRKKINTNQYNVIGTLCENINSKKKYCKEVFSSSFWDKISLGEKSPNYIKNICREISRKKTLKREDYKSCSGKLNSEPENCTYSNLSYPALFPKPNCDAIGKALNYSRLFSEYKDCPAQIGNESVSNLGRLIRHFNKDIGSENSFCFTDTIHAFAKTNIDADNDNSWGTNICYFDKIKNKDICYPTVLGNVKDSDIDIGAVTVKVLNRVKGISSKTKCTAITDKKYNPAILKYRTGCYITTDKYCLASDCIIKVMYQEKELSGFKYETGFDFGYLTNEINQSKYSQLSILERQLKRKNKQMLNTTFIKNMLNKHTNSIIHGIGCAEDILPHYFKKKSFNQCHPLPFLVDGFIEENGFFTFVVRTAIDDIHSPRLITWSYLFNGVKNYQVLHPLNKWSMHATY